MALPVQARIRLGSLGPDDVSVQLYDGPVDAQGRIAAGQAEEMTVATAPPVVSHAPGDGDGQESGAPGASADGVYTYAGAIPCRTSGLHGYSVRVVPKHPDLANPYETALIAWAG
jgi:starch phosphorylase